MKTNFITGITGQCGSILAEKLLNRGDKVYGLIRRTSTPNDSRIVNLLSNKNLELIQGDVTDSTSISHAIAVTKPDYYFNAAAQAHVAVSFSEPLNSFYNTALGCVNGLEAIRLFSPNTKYLQFSTSELFGSNYDEEIINGVTHKFQRETTRMVPQSPYAVAKLAAHEMCRLYRQSYKLFAACGIFMNMESHLRGETYVTRKITRYLGRLVANCGYCQVAGSDTRYGFYEDKLKTFPKLKLGNLNASRDWQSAHLAMDAAILILEQEKPDDFLIASGTSHTIKDFLDLAFKYANLDWNNFVETDVSLLRPSEVSYLHGRPQKAKLVLGWDFDKNSFNDLVLQMVDFDIKLGFLEKK